MNIELKNSAKPVDYIESVRILEERVKDVLQGKKREFVWILEHKTVFTAGTSFLEEELIDKNINIIKTNRGGKLTVHSPGQKIIYFVLNLNKRKKDIRYLVNQIENCIINILLEYKINSYPDKKNIGIWVNNNNNSYKIAAIGIRVKKWIAYHGFSINLYNDLNKYDGIVPCGIRDKGITSMKELGINNFDNINDVISRKFLDIFL